MLIAELGAVLEVLEIHVVLRDELKRTGGSCGFAGVFFAHPLHRVDVAVPSCAAKIAIKPSTVKLAQQMHALFMDHWHRQFLIESRVPKANGDTISSARLLVDRSRCL